MLVILEEEELQRKWVYRASGAGSRLGCGAWQKVSLTLREP